MSTVVSPSFIARFSLQAISVFSLFSWLARYGKYLLFSHTNYHPFALWISGTAYNSKSSQDHIDVNNFHAQTSDLEYVFLYCIFNLIDKDAKRPL